MKSNILFIIIIIIVFIVSSKLSAQQHHQPDTVLFREVWGYLMKSEEKNLRGTEPFTDICYFSAAFDNKGNLVGDITPPVLAINGEIPFRMHLVVSELTNYARTHYVLHPKFSARKTLIRNIVQASRLYDGIQIDFESVPAKDARHFYAFLKDLKKRLPQKTLSVAVLARRSKSDDAYDYAAISRVADRLIIMAYDQHYSTSKPGPVASKSWAEAVARYAISAVPRHKLIMGLPLYGRTWQEKRFDRALRFSHLEELIEHFKITPTEDEENGLRFEFEAPVRVIGYYESIYSIMAKLRLYASLGITTVSFWRVGQEDKTLWERIWVQ
jgi:spore germination protein YaaH